MSHKNTHVILLKGSFVFNRRVPMGVARDFGSDLVRVSLGKNRDDAEVIAAALSAKLDEVWASPTVKPIAISKLLALVKPKVLSLEDAMQLYIDDRGDGRGDRFEDSARLACSALTDVSGCREIETYTRADAKAFIRELASRGVKTSTIRRRLDIQRGD